MARELLWNPDVRLVTLLGPGGMGKTRLAVAIAWDLHGGPGFADGVFFVDLAPVTDPGLVPATVARALGIADTGDPGARLCAALRDVDALIVLDNFEQLIGASGFVADLLAAARRLSLLVTSRRPLHLRGEHQIEVQPLELRDAVELFADRARAVKPDFALNPMAIPAVESICRELDCHPLAIELAAARSKLLTPAELHSLLGDSLNVLTGGPTDQPERLRSMYATIAWSYDALSANVQLAFRRLSVFTGGWTIEGAGSVCAVATGTVVEILTTLLDQHLVQRAEGDTGARYSMFETVREFGCEQLERDLDAEATHVRHAHYCADLVRMAESELAKVDQADWLDRVEREHDNIRSALQWAIAAQPDVALVMAGAMWRFWLLRGYVSEGLDWLERTLAMDDDQPSLARARALVGSGSMFEAIGDDASAEARYREGLRNWELLGDRAGMAMAYRHLGNAAIGRGLYDDAIGFYTAALAIGTELHDDQVSAGAVANLGSVAYFQGDYRLAEQHWTEAAAFFRAASDFNRLASVLNNLAELAELRGGTTEAVALHEEVLLLRHRLRDPIGLAQTMVNLGKAVQSFDLARARSLLEEALSRLRALGIHRDTGSCLYNLALVAQAEGRLAEAGALVGEAATIKHSSDERFELAQCLELLAGIAAERRLGTRAARLLGAAAAVRTSIGARPPGDEPQASAVYEAVRDVVGEAGLRAGIAEGEQWTVERAMAEATEIALVSPARPFSDALSAEERGLSPAARRVGLTSRETEILAYLAARYTDREIADTLHIGLRTVTTHVGRILVKLAVDGRRQAAAEAARLGLVAS